MITSWILNAISKDIAASIFFVEYAEEIWKELEEHFSQDNDPKSFQLRRMISTLWQENSSIISYSQIGIMRWITELQTISNLF